MSASGVRLASVLVTAYQRLFSEPASPSPLREGLATSEGPHHRVVPSVCAPLRFRACAFTANLGLGCLSL